MPVDSGQSINSAPRRGPPEHAGADGEADDGGRERADSSAAAQMRRSKGAADIGNKKNRRTTPRQRREDTATGSGADASEGMHVSERTQTPDKSCQNGI